MTPPPALAVRALGVAFGRGRAAVRAVRDVDFAIARGEAYGLIGESGSGKSTVLRAVAGLNAGYEGDVLLDGAPAARPRDAAFLRRVQMVFQDPFASLHPRKLVRAALMEPLEIHRAPQRERRVAEALDAVGLDRGFAYRYPHQLSGGQRQRVAVARALILQPQVLLLDEPTSALDVSVQAGVLNLLDALRRERGLTYLLVSHDLAVVAHMCDRLAVMTDGRIVEELSADDLRAGRAQHPYTRALIAASRAPAAARATPAA